MAIQSDRTVIQTFSCPEESEGPEALIRCSIGGPKLKNLDPFLLLEEFNIRPPAGYPDHPHRGFEAINYIFKGRSEQEDFTGHKSMMGPGDLLWVTAGRGIVHSDVPALDNVTEVTGLQLWVNLPSKLKMCEPAYQELQKHEIPKASKDGVTVCVLSGESLGVKSKVYTRTPTMYLDIKLVPNAKHRQAVLHDWTVFAYTLSGEVVLAENKVTPHHTVVFGKGDFVQMENKSSDEVHFVLIAGEPINEPIVQHGTFVMNTEQEIKSTIKDFEKKRNGFENAANWKSSRRKHES